jgi:hypothetical protein
MNLLPLSPISPTLDAYPMMRGAGLFVLLVGLGITIGGILGKKYLVPVLIVGGVLAILSQIVRVRGLTDFAGTPPMSQLYALCGGIAFEGLLIGVVVYLIRDRSSRRFWLWILFVVGLHFIVLAYAQGPPLLLLGVLNMVNAAVGLRMTNVSYLKFWVIDGVLKVAIGAWMLSTG